MTLPIPERYGDTLPLWAEKQFKESWYFYARNHGMKYTSPIKYEIERYDERRDRVWRATRTCKRSYKRDGTLRLAVYQEGDARRRYKPLLDETNDERKRLDLLAGRGTVVVSPLRGGNDVGQDVSRARASDDNDQ